MEKDSKRHLKNRKEKNMAGKKSILTALFTSILRLNLAVALLIFLSIIVNAGDVTVGIGDIYSEKNNELFLSLKNIEAGGHDYRLVSAGSSGGIGVGKFAVYDATAGSARLTIDTNGNVGIGTTSPASGFQTTIQGTSGSLIPLLLTGTGAGYADLYLDNTDATVANRYAQVVYRDNGVIKWSHGLVAGDNKFHFRDSTGAEKVIIDATGNVGIGTVEPVRKLHVNSDDWASPAEIHASGLTSGFSFTNRDAGRTWETAGQPGTRWVLYSREKSAALWANEVGDRIAFTEPYQRDKNKGWGAVWIAPQEVNSDSAVEGAELFLSAPRKADGSIKAAEMGIDNYDGNFRIVMQDKVGGNWFVPMQIAPSGKVTVAGDISLTAGGLYMPNAYGPDSNYYTNNQFIAFGHPGFSEDFIGYKSNTFYFKDSPGGGDTKDPDVVVGGNVNVFGKLTASKGIDPPYISFSGESYQSIRQYAKNVEEHEKAMLFWNNENHRLEVYDTNEDAFYMITGEKIEG